MFDKNYYENKMSKLEAKLSTNKDATIKSMTDILSLFWKETKEIQVEFQEIEKMLKENKKSTKITKPK